jgi:hypothetical protein
MRSTTAALVLALVLPAAAADTPIGWEDAEKHVGEEATVEGRILGIHCSPLSCLLAFEPTFNRFTAVIQAESFGAFPPEDQLRSRYEGRRARVHGTIRERDKKPEIVLAKPEDLALAQSPREKERDTERAAQAQAEVMERLADVLERVEALTERMATTQERMDAVLAQLEQRTADLAGAQPPPPPLAPEQPERHAYETLRSLKRGMSRQDVQRLAGAPLYVEQSPNGSSTWYYSYGRSVTFNARGRAEALAGF